MYIELGLSFVLGVILFFLLNIIFKLPKKTQSKILLFFILILCIVLTFSLTRITSLIISMLNNDNNVAANINSDNNTITKTNIDNINESNDAIREDLQNYLNEIQEVGELENQVLSLYESIIGENYISDEISYNKLKEEIIPLSINMLEMAEKITPKTNDVAEIHQTAILYMNKRISAFNQMLIAIENQDESQILSANELLTETDKGATDYLESIVKLANEHNVVFDLENFNNNLANNSKNVEETVNSSTSDSESINIVSLYLESKENISSILGNDFSIENMDDLYTAYMMYEDISFGLNDAKNIVVSIYVNREQQSNLEKFNADGITFSNNNKEIYDALGKPYYGDKNSFVYNYDFGSLKLDFDYEGKLITMRIFQAPDNTGGVGFEW